MRRVALDHLFDQAGQQADRSAGARAQSDRTQSWLLVSVSRKERGTVCCHNRCPRNRAEARPDHHDRRGHDGQLSKQKVPSPEMGREPMSPAKVVSDWWFGTMAQRITLVGGAMTAALTAILTVMHFMEVQEPRWIATRGFVRDLVQQTQMQAQTRSDNLSNRVIGTEIAIKLAERGRVQGQIDRNALELEKSPQAPDGLKRLITEQIRQYQEQIKMIELELDELRRQHHRQM